MDLLKETAIVSVTAGIPLLFRAHKFQSGGELTQKVVAETLQISALIAFYMNLATLPLWAEILTQGLIALLIVLIPVSKMQGNTRSITGCLQSMLGTVGAGLFVYSTVVVLREWSNLDHSLLLREIALNVWLPIALIPLVYVLAFLMRIEVIMAILPFHNAKTTPPLRVRFAIVQGLRFSAKYANEFAGAYLGEVASVSSCREGRRRMVNFRKDVRNKDLADKARRERLELMTGVKGVDPHGLTRDRREFAATKRTLLYLRSIQMGWYVNRSQSFRVDLLTLAGELTKHGLPADAEIHVSVAKDRQAWYAYRTTPSGMVLGVGGAVVSDDRESVFHEWHYSGDRPPSAHPGVGRSGWWNASSGADSIEWMNKDED